MCLEQISTARALHIVHQPERAGPLGLLILMRCLPESNSDKTFWVSGKALTYSGLVRQPQADSRLSTGGGGPDRFAPTRV